MIRYSNCGDVEFGNVFQAFKIGFSDYIIKLEISEEGFMKRFFGPEGNELNYSFIAFDDEQPIGLILGGIRHFDGQKTLRCGTMCIHPEYRGKGIAKELFELHRQVAVENRCEQMFLEVINGNERAEKFYQSKGYEGIYDISYYTWKSDNNEILQGIDSVKNNSEQNELWSNKVTQITLQDIRKIEDQFSGTHINWQNSLESIEKQDGIFHYGIFKENELISALSIDGNGKIYLIWTKMSERNQGIAKGMLDAAIEQQKLCSLSTGTSNNASLIGFLRRNNFEKGAITQHEMYLWKI